MRTETAMNLRVGFIGAGKVGTSLGKHFTEHGIPVSGYYSRTEQSARESATFTKTNYYKNLEDIITASDVLFLTVSDRVIAKIWQDIKPYLKDNPKLVCHCSGALTSHIFSGIEDTGSYGFSVHPLLAVSSRYDSYQEISKALFTIESDAKEQVRILVELLESTGIQVQLLQADQKVRYHSAAVMSSNLMVGLIHGAEQVLQSIGFSEENAHQAIAPLLSLNAKSIAEQGCMEALTGPVERNDVATVKAEMDELKGLDHDFGEIYRLLSKQAAEVAEAKHLDRNYSKLNIVLEEHLGNI